MKEIRVLFADDHRILLDGIVSFIERNAEDKNTVSPSVIRVVGVANNGEEALRVMKDTQVDVAVLDITMPIMDGMEAAQIIRKQYPSTKIILLTMSGEGNLVLSALQSGLDGYIVKEKSSETLIQAIRQVYQGQSYYSPELLRKLQYTTIQKTTSPNNTSPLTNQEMKVLCYMAKNPNKNVDIVSNEFNVSVLTMRTHIRNIKLKLNMKKSAEFTKYALENNLL